MDNLKSCYTTQVRLRLQPELLATLRWYWAPTGALPFPGEHAFGSSVWETEDRDYPQPDLGEVSLTRTWDKGVTAPGVSGQGTPTPLSWFTDGVPAEVLGPYPSGRCPGAQLLYSCVNCPGGALVTHTLSAENFRFGWGVLNGMTTLSYGGSCTWTSQFRLCSFPSRPPPDFTLIEELFPNFPANFQTQWLLTVRPAGMVHLTLDVPGFGSALWQGGPWDCQSRIVLTLTGQPAQPKDVPLTLILNGGVGDMPLIGSVIWDAGVDDVPADYLLCDGSRVSQTAYAMLWGRIGFTYGPDLGDGLFPLPNLLDCCPVGSGHTYPTGATGGEATHTLIAAEVPNVPISITDPGHQHGPGVAGESFYTRLTTGTFAAIAAGSGASRDAFTNVQTTGISASMATALGGAHNNLQPYVALRPLIYAGI